MDAIERFGLVLKAAARETDRQINDLLRPLGITSAQAEALQVLHAVGSASLGELGGLLVAEGGHPSRLVDRLVAAGLVERRHADADRRRVELSCSERGAELARQARAFKEPFRDRLKTAFDGLPVEAAVEVLEACVAGSALEATVRRRQDRAGSSAPAAEGVPG
jgi:DNA-binding MarR family transcriptional regulator